MNEEKIVTVIFMVVASAATVFAYFLGALRGIEHLQRRLVKEGYAEYYLDLKNERQWRIKSK